MNLCANFLSCVLHQIILYCQVFPLICLHPASLFSGKTDCTCNFSGIKLFGNLYGFDVQINEGIHCYECTIKCLFIKNVL